MLRTVVLSISCILFIFAACALYKQLQRENFSWAEYTPRVKGVTIPNRNAVMLQSALDAGMLTPDAIQEILPSQPTSHEDQYKEQVATVENTLELDQTLQDERVKVAAAVSNYIPPEGANTLPGLWTQRNTVDNLFQPGLNGKTGQPTCSSACK